MSSSILARYTRFSKPLPEARKSTVRILKHWNVGENPQLYDFTAITRKFEREVEISQMSTSERKRAEAKERRLERIRAKENEKFSQLSQTADSQTGASFSQPVPGSQSLSVRPKQSLLKAALERDQANSQTPFSSQRSLGSQSQQPKKKRTKGF
jgi:hypothetical protein